MTIQDQLEELFRQQAASFELARKNFTNLQHAIYRNISFDKFNINIQFNPDRILSTNAKIDKATLQNRKCFLCPDYMPTDQKGLSYTDRYHIYINPYPIFNKHFTVPASSHSPQLIENRFGDMLDLAYDLQDYTLFYNGPQCGASAPDHFHFQIAPRQIMPIESDTENESIVRPLIQEDYYSVSTIDNYLRKIIILKASDRELLIRLFTRITTLTGQLTPYEQEPRQNILAWFDNCQWTVCLLPRKLLRPWQFFAERDEKILFSPGCVDMGGLVIAPRMEDFERYDHALLTDLFGQVTITDDTWKELEKSLISNIRI